MNKKLKIAVIGVSKEGIGNAHSKAILENDNTELVTICEIVPEFREYAEKTYGVPCVENYKDILQDENIEAVVVATNDQSHCQIVCDLLRNKKHVLCEKPMSLKLSECEEMMKVAKETGMSFMVGQLCRFTPGFVKAKELFDAGEIGDLFFIESEYAHDYSCMNQPFQAWRRGNDRPGLLGGGCHAVDLIRWFAGNPVEAFGYSNHKMLPDWETDDCSIGIMKFENDVIGKIFCSTGCQREYTMRTVIYGTKGTIITDNHSTHITLFKKEINGEENSYGTPSRNIRIEIPVAIASHNVPAEIEIFSKGILENKGVAITGFEGAATVAVCTAILDACRTGQPQKI